MRVRSLWGNLRLRPCHIDQVMARSRCSAGKYQHRPRAATTCNIFPLKGYTVFPTKTLSWADETNFGLTSPKE